ncbi:exported hypothetical protein [Frankia sp. AiPs1]
MVFARCRRAVVLTMTAWLSMGGNPLALPRGVRRGSFPERWKLGWPRQAVC